MKNFGRCGPQARNQINLRLVCNCLVIRWLALVPCDGSFFPALMGNLRILSTSLPNGRDLVNLLTLTFTGRVCGCGDTRTDAK